MNQPIVVGANTYVYRLHTLTHLVLSAVPSVLAESQSDSFPAERAVCSWTAKGTQFKLPPTYTPQFQYFNHMSGCSVQCANRAALKRNGARNLVNDCSTLEGGP